MAASNVDKLRKKKSNFSTTLSAGINDSDATIPLSSASGLATDTAITLTVDRVDGNSVSTPTLVERLTGVISGNNLTVTLRGEDGSTAQAHDAGAVVEDIWDADTWNEAVDAILAEHSQAGAHTVDVINEKTGAAGVTIDSLLIKDGDIPNARLSSKVITATRTMADASGDVEYTGVGFKPTSIIALGSDGTVSESIGIGDVDEAMWLIAKRLNSTVFSGASLVSVGDVGGNDFQRAVIKSYDADGFTLTWLKVGTPPAGTASLAFLCFR